MIKFFSVPGLAVLLILAGCGSNGSSGSPSRPASTSGAGSSAATSLTGAGSTFDLPFFSKAFAVYKSKRGVSVNYQAIGSGAGIQQFTAKTVNFGASDVPMNSTELAAAQKAGGAVIQLPIALGGVSIAYNLPGIKSGLRLSGDVISRIYLGSIKS